MKGAKDRTVRAALSAPLCSIIGGLANRRHDRSCGPQLDSVIEEVTLNSCVVWHTSTSLR